MMEETEEDTWHQPLVATDALTHEHRQANIYNTQKKNTFKFLLLGFGIWLCWHRVSLTCMEHWSQSVALYTPSVVVPVVISEGEELEVQGYP